MQIPPNNGLTYFNNFRRVYKDVAKEKDIALIPFFLDDVATK
jgi:acyl-CoA thioesterase-1